MQTIQFKNRKFKVVEVQNFDDGSQELVLEGSRAAIYNATFYPHEQKWKLKYLDKTGKGKSTLWAAQDVVWH